MVDGDHDLGLRVDAEGSTGGGCKRNPDGSTNYFVDILLRKIMNYYYCFQNSDDMDASEQDEGDDDRVLPLPSDGL